MHISKAARRRALSFVALGALVAAAAACGPGTTATAISAGRASNCAIVAEGKVKCWGSNGYGQVGNGTLVDAPTPVEVVGITGATAIATGDHHACAIVANGAVKCWGGNGQGELGNNTISTGSSTPVDVFGLTGATAIAVGTFHSCAVVDLGAVKCWGYNQVGQLGTGTGSTPKPLPVKNVTGAIAVTAGWNHTCALLGTGDAACWGANESGQLGTGDTAGSMLAKAVTGLTGATAISAGDYHTCALVAGGAAQCWGRNTYGALGNGTFTSSSSPVAVTGLTGATALDAGGYQTCAALTGGTASCWGDGYYGQLGNGTPYLSGKVPAAVTSLTGATAVTTSGSHACALVSGGAIRCWGNNTAKQLGQGAVNVDAVTYNLADQCADASGCNGASGEADIAAYTGTKADVYALQNWCSDRTQPATALGSTYRVLSAPELGPADGGACGSETATVGNVLFVTKTGSTTWAPVTVPYTATDAPYHRNFACAHTQVRYAPAFVCTTHLAEGADPAIAQAEAAELLAYVTTHRKGFEVEIIAGDFNLARSADGLGWDKAWTDAGYVDVNATNAPTDAQGLATDHIWVNQGSVATSSTFLGTHSDHAALAARVTPFLFASPLPVPVA